MQKIFIDGSKLRSDFAGGVVNYISKLFENLQVHEEVYHIKSKVILVDKILNEQLLTSHMEKARDAKVVKSFFQFTRLILFGNDEYTVFHSPYMFLPPKRNGKINILTVLDMINFERPFTLRNVFRKFMLHVAIKRANFYICISDATKQKLQSHFPSIKDSQIAITHLGIDPHFFSVSATSQFRNLVQTPYLLYVGQRGDYKNFKSLLKFKAESSRAKEMKILCVGGGSFTKSEMVQLNQYDLNDSVIHVGYSSTDDLKFLYQHAIALAYTSLEEGFGLPILEAMACCCPVICGNFSSMKEVAGSHAILVEDFSVHSIEMAVDKANDFKSEQLESAKLYASTFTWEKTTLQTMEIYQKIGARA